MGSREATAGVVVGSARTLVENPMTTHNAGDIDHATQVLREWGLHGEPLTREVAEKAIAAVSDRIAARALTDAADALRDDPSAPPYATAVGTWLRARAADLGEER